MHHIQSSWPEDSFLQSPVPQADAKNPLDLWKTEPRAWPDFMVGQRDNPVRVLVVNHDPLIRRVMMQELAGDLRTLAVGEADTLRKARRLIRDCDFDVMLADLNLSDGSGFDLIAYSKAVRSMAEIVVVSILNKDQDAIRAFELGAAGFLVKNSCLGNFSQAVLDVANGGAAITPTLARRLLLRDRGQLQAGALDGDLKITVRLSEREKEILRLIAMGLTSPEIGRRLAIAAMTVNVHVRNIYRKLHVRSRAQAVSRATTWGFL